MYGSHLALTLTLVMTALVACGDDTALDTPDADAGGLDTGTSLDAFVGDSGPVADAGDVGDVGDVGAADTGGPDGSDASLPRSGCPAHASEFFCDDFETGEVDLTRYAQDVRAGGAVDIIEAEDAISGNHVMRATVGLGGGSRAMLEARDVLPIPTNRFFGRAFITFSPRLPEVHSFLLAATGDLEGEFTQYRLDSNDGRLNSRYQSPAADAIQHGGFRKLGLRPAADAWLCVEWEFDGSMNAVRVYFDGVEDVDMRVTASEDPPWTAPEFDRFSFGLHAFQEQSGPVEIRWDDVALATERIGCGPS